MSNQTHKTGRFDKLGDELIVFPGYSDFGTDGWFTGRLMIDRRDPSEVYESKTPMIFFETREAAMSHLDNGYYAKFA